MTTAVTSGELMYTVSEDCRLSYEAVAVGRAESEVAGAATPPGLTLTTPRTDLRVTVVGADFCLAADVARAFPAPAPVALTISADGFAPLTATVTVDPASIPVTVGVLRLRPLPVRIQGRIVARDTGSPFTDARVRTIDDPTVGTPPPVHTIALGRPLVRAHAVGTSVEEVAITAAGPSAPLAAAAALGDASLALLTRSGLSTGDVLGIEATAAGDFGEVVRVADPGPTPLAAPGAVTLRDPLTRGFAAGAPVALLTLGSPVATTSLADAAEAGDAIVVANDVVTGLLRVEPGPDEEYRFVGAVTDGAGYYRLDGVGHVLALWLAADAPAYQQGNQAVTVPYGTPVTVVDFQLSP